MVELGEDPDREGLLKFAYVNQGLGRFTKLGMPMPGVLAPAIAVLEIDRVERSVTVVESPVASARTQPSNGSLMGWPSTVKR